MALASLLSSLNSFLRFLTSSPYPCSPTPKPLAMFVMAFGLSPAAMARPAFIMFKKIDAFLSSSNSPSNCRGSNPNSLIASSCMSASVGSCPCSFIFVTRASTFWFRVLPPTFIASASAIPAETSAKAFVTLSLN